MSAKPYDPSVKEFLGRLRTNLGEKPWRKLLGYARKDRIKWNESTAYSGGPTDQSGG